MTKDEFWDMIGEAMRCVDCPFYDTNCDNQCGERLRDMYEGIEQEGKA